MSATLFVSVGEGAVDEQNWTRLRDMYEAHRQDMPKGLLQSYLLQNTAEPVRWRVVNFWENEYSYEQAHSGMEGFTCEDLFGAVDSMPEVQTLTNKEVVQLIVDNIWEI